MHAAGTCSHFVGFLIILYMSLKRYVFGARVADALYDQTLVMFRPKGVVRFCP